jgi:V/A-type H+-transporting ATPase subunit E
MSKLRDILQEEAFSEINKILAEADSRAEVLMEGAKRKASEQVEAYRKKAEVELRVGTRRAESAAELTISTARARARGEAMALVRTKALNALEEIVRRPDYDHVLETLAEEALKVWKAAEALVVHPDDRDKLSAWAKQKGLRIQTDPELHLGVRMTASGGQRSVENSLPRRLERAWETLASSVAHRLWGEGQ